MTTKRITTLRLVAAVSVFAAACGSDPLADRSRGGDRLVIPGQLVYHSNVDGNFEIYRFDPATGDRHRLTDHPARDVGPVVSPDKTKIAFVSDRDGSEDVFVMNIDGSNPVNLTRSPGRDEGPTWSPDGTAIAFTSDRREVRHIWRMDADGANPVILTWIDELQLNENWDPAWSPDGQSIAFATNREVFSERIYLMGSDGSNPRPLPGSPGVGWQATDAPAWAPDGAELAFSAIPWESEEEEIYLARPGDLPFSLAWATAPGRSTGEPIWSPDGSMVAYEQETASGTDIWVIELEGWAMVALTESPGVSEGSPAWF